MGCRDVSWICTVTSSNMISNIYNSQSIDLKPIFCLIISAYSCISHIMTMVPVESSIIDDSVKILLSCWHEMSSDKENPSWFRGNIVSFINFKSQIDRYGSIRYYWEGNRERFIQTVKPFLKNMRKTDSYLDKKMLDLHTSIALRELLTKADVRGKWRTGETYPRHKAMFIYNSRMDLDKSISLKKPISAIILARNITEKVTSICCNNTDSNINVYDVIWNYEGESKCGMWYSAMEISEKPSISNIDSTHIHEIVVDYAILNVGFDHYYCAITMNWLVRDEGGRYSLPILCPDMFL